VETYSSFSIIKLAQLNKYALTEEQKEKLEEIKKSRIPPFANWFKGSKKGEKYVRVGNEDRVYMDVPVELQEEKQRGAFDLSSEETAAINYLNNLLFDLKTKTYIPTFKSPTKRYVEPFSKKVTRREWAEGKIPSRVKGRTISIGKFLSQRIKDQEKKGLSALT